MEDRKVEGVVVVVVVARFARQVGVTLNNMAGYNFGLMLKLGMV